MKRVFSGLIAVMMLLSMSVFSYAGSPEVLWDKKNTYVLENEINDLFIYDDIEFSLDQGKEKKVKKQVIDSKLNVDKEEAAVFVSGASEIQKSSTNNTSPNEAVVMGLNTAITNSIEIQGEQRWFATVLNEQSKMSVIIQLAQSQDFDLYVYKLNETSMTLESVDFSTNSIGVNESSSNVLDSGIYYFMVHGYSGTGDFGVYLFSSTYDNIFEINDSLDQAFDIGALIQRKMLL